MSSPVASPAEKSDQPKRKRGWRRLFQFRLRAILILTTLIAIWLGWWLHNARQQREAVAELRKAGAGTILYDFQIQGQDSPPYWPAWLVNSLGVDCFAEVTGVGFYGTQGTDADLAHLKDLTSLQVLNLSYTQVADAGLEHLKGLTSLQVLDLDNTQVTDAGLEHLKGLTSLNTLELHNTQVTDAGLEHLNGLKALVWLDLTKTQVTDAGVARLQESLPNCDIDH